MARAALVDELRRSRPPFALPELVELVTIGDRHGAIERRLPGRAVNDQLRALDPADRPRLLDALLDAVATIGDLHLDPRPWFGDLLDVGVVDGPIRRPTWADYLAAKVDWSLARAPGFEAVDGDTLTAELLSVAPGPMPGQPGSFVHLDADGRNVLAAGTEVAAVIDIGATSVVGDRRLDPLATAVYLQAEPITPGLTAADHDVVERWLQRAGLADGYEAARRWLAGYWAWAVDDPTLHRWCRGVLLD